MALYMAIFSAYSAADPEEVAWLFLILLFDSVVRDLINLQEYNLVQQLTLARNWPEVQLDRFQAEKDTEQVSEQFHQAERGCSCSFSENTLIFDQRLMSPRNQPPCEQAYCDMIIFVLFMDIAKKFDI